MITAGAFAKTPSSHTLPSTCWPLRGGNGCSVHVDGPSCSMTSKPWKGPSLDPDPLQIQKAGGRAAAALVKVTRGQACALDPTATLSLWLSFWIRSMAEPVDRFTWCEPPIAVLPKSCN